MRAVDVERRRESFVLGIVLAHYVWEEIKRRFGVLNHAHEKAVEVQHTYVTQEKYDDHVTAEQTNAGVVAKALTLAEGKGIGQEKFWLVLVAVATLLLMAMAIVATIFVGIVAAIVVILTK